MNDVFRARVADELAGTDEPPLGDLVTAAEAKGRRMLLARRLRLGGVAALVAALVVIGGVVLIGRAPAAQRVQPAAAKVPATAAGVLELLTTLLTTVLPTGKTSGYAATTEDGEPFVQLYLDTGSGPGMLRVGVFHGSEDPWTTDAELERAATDCLAQTGAQCADARDTTLTTPQATGDGTMYQVQTTPGNCVQHTRVTVLQTKTVLQTNLTLVTVDIASCLAWSGTTNPPAPLALTVQQAVQVASSPRWGTTMDKALVDAGAGHFPQLPPLR